MLSVENHDKIFIHIFRKIRESDNWVKCESKSFPYSLDVEKFIDITQKVNKVLDFRFQSLNFALYRKSTNLGRIVSREKKRGSQKTVIGKVKKDDLFRIINFLRGFSANFRDKRIREIVFSFKNEDDIVMDFIQKKLYYKEEEAEDVIEEDVSEIFLHIMNNEGDQWVRRELYSFPYSEDLETFFRIITRSNESGWLDLKAFNLIFEPHKDFSNKENQMGYIISSHRKIRDTRKVIDDRSMSENVIDALECLNEIREVFSNTKEWRMLYTFSDNPEELERLIKNYT